MRTQGTAAEVAGAAMLALVLTACGAGGSGSSPHPGSGADSHKGGSKRVALQVDSTVRKATWTGGNATHRLTLAPERLVRGTAADLDGVQLDGDLRGMIPYYLTVRYTNTDPKTLTRLGPQDDFTVTLADGTPGRAVSLWNTNTLATRSSSSIPDGCDKSGPARLSETITPPTSGSTPADRPDSGRPKKSEDAVQPFPHPAGRTWHQDFSEGDLGGSRGF